MNNEYMTGRDIRGNTYAMRELTDEEKATLEERTDTRGHQKHMLLLRDHEGIALPDWCRDRAEYYGGLGREKYVQHIIVDDEDYWMWNYDDAEKRHEKDMEKRWDEGRDPWKFDRQDTNLFQFYIGPLTNWGEDDE